MSSFIADDFVVESKDSLIPLYESLLNREINSSEDFRHFLKDVSDLESTISEDMAWRYIKMTCDTQDKEIEQRYLFFVQEIQPAIAPYDDKINQKIVSCSYCAELEQSPEYAIYFRGLKSAVELFREENIPLQAELQSLAQQYASIMGAMSITYQNKEFTLQQASNFLMETDRNVREEVWKLLRDRRKQDIAALEDIFDKMVSLRHKVAQNSGFANYRDYMFKALGRFDYTVQDCENFHNAIAKVVVPLLREITGNRKKALGYDVLKPWDTAVDPYGRNPLKPFESGNELLAKSKLCFEDLDTFFSNCLNTMEQKHLFDLESRIGKAPGGYNYPLAKTNLPFIFMNASGNLRDVETMVHEGGHAIHSFLMAPLELNAFKNTPSEVAELASMSMELLSMKSWSRFMDGNDLNRAKTEQLEGIISTLPWIATVDAFQHWIYTHPDHNREERKAKWLELNNMFGTGMVDYTGYEEALEYGWHKQLHIFEVPFYYIEYGFAQLGAIGVWKNFSENEIQGLQQYKEALKLGYTRGIPEIYKTAGVQFDFSEQYLNKLFGFVSEKLHSYH